MVKQAKINLSQKETNKETGVSLKELFERVVALETKLDIISTSNAKATDHFGRLATGIIILLLLNLALTTVILIRWL